MKSVKRLRMENGNKIMKRHTPISLITLLYSTLLYSFYPTLIFPSPPPPLLSSPSFSSLFSLSIFRLTFSLFNLFQFIYPSVRL